MQMNLSPQNPLVLLALAGAGFWLWTRSQAAQAAPLQATMAGGTKGRAVPVRSTGQTYQNPVDVAATLARPLVQLLTGVRPPAPRGDANSVADILAQNNRALVRAADADADYYGTSAADGWVSGVTGTVNAQAMLRRVDAGFEVDSSPSAPVYDTSVDYMDGDYLNLW